MGPDFELTSNGWKRKKKNLQNPIVWQTKPLKKRAKGGVPNLKKNDNEPKLLKHGPNIFNATTLLLSVTNLIL